MKPVRILAALAVVAAIAAAGVSAASTDFTSAHGGDFYAAGKHKFYVWCASGKDRIAYQSGASAEDAQMTLYHATATQKCWPIWQGRISG
jgi:hypothetical protein